MLSLLRTAQNAAGDSLEMLIWYTRQN